MHHRSLKRRIEDRKLRLAPPLDISKQLGSTKPSTWQLPANVATAVSAIVTTVALIFGAYQFSETMRAQRDAIFLQQKALESERSSKAADLYAKYLDVAYSKPPNSNYKGREAEQFILARNDRALLLLNAMYSVSKGDPQWQEIVDWSLLRFDSFAKERKVRCLSLTNDFRLLIEQQTGGKDIKICRDLTDSD